MISKLQRKTNGGELQQQKRSRVLPPNWVRKLPDEVWTCHVLPCSTLKELLELSCLNTGKSVFNKFWKDVVESCHHIRVICCSTTRNGEGQTQIDIPEGKGGLPQLYCTTIERAVYVVTHMTVPGTVTVELSKGIYELSPSVMNCVVYHGCMNVTCSNITFVGKGQDQTTIIGGIKVYNQQCVKFEELTVTNPNGRGLAFGGKDTTGDVLKCVVKECGHIGMWVRDGATVTATDSEFMENGGHGVCCSGANTKARLNDCQMHHNGGNGLSAYLHAVLDLHGTKTDIHSNKQRGIHACSRGKINIHLPSQHNTSHDNVTEDRGQHLGGSIANINADGTFTHVEDDE